MHFEKGGGKKNKSATAMPHPSLFLHFFCLFAFPISRLGSTTGFVLVLFNNLECWNSSAVSSPEGYSSCLST